MITTQIELTEILDYAITELQEQDLLIKSTKIYPDDVRLENRNNAFQSVIATGLNVLLNNGEIKTDFDYLGNNNHIKLLLNDETLEKLLKK